MENTIQTRPISELPEMTKDSKDASFLMFDEEDQTAKRMPRSIAPVFVIVGMNVTLGDSPVFTINSVSHTPNEVRALLASGTPICILMRASDYYAGVKLDEYSIFGYWSQTLEDIERVKGIMISDIGSGDFSIYAVDGSNTWEVGRLPENSST